MPQGSGDKSYDAVILIRPTGYELGQHAALRARLPALFLEYPSVWSAGRQTCLATQAHALVDLVGAAAHF